MTEISTHIHTAAREERPTETEAGQALVEYGLILVLVSIIAVGLTPLGQWVADHLAEVKAAF
jgi:Flp pilus assembly pilin Flp